MFLVASYQKSSRSKQLHVLFWGRVYRLSYHVEDEELASIPYVCDGAAEQLVRIHSFWSWRIWQGGFQPYAVSRVSLRPWRGPKQIIPMKSTIFETKYLSNLQCRVEGLCDIQPKRPFVVLIPRAYHGGFNGGYNVAKATNPASFLWFDVGREVSKRSREVTLLLEVTHCFPNSYSKDFQTFKMNADIQVSRTVSMSQKRIFRLLFYYKFF